MKPVKEKCPNCGSFVLLIAGVCPSCAKHIDSAQRMPPPLPPEAIQHKSIRCNGCGESIRASVNPGEEIKCPACHGLLIVPFPEMLKDAKSSSPEFTDAETAAAGLGGVAGGLLFFILGHTPFGKGLGGFKGGFCGSMLGVGVVYFIVTLRKAFLRSEARQFFRTHQTAIRLAFVLAVALTVFVVLSWLKIQMER